MTQKVVLRRLLPLEGTATEEGGEAPGDALFEPDRAEIEIDDRITADRFDATFARRRSLQ